MRVALVLTVLVHLSGCGDNHYGPLEVETLDATTATFSVPDAGPDDAWTHPDNPCCSLLFAGDEQGFRDCEGYIPPGSCGVFVCYADDGGIVTRNFCG